MKRIVTLLVFALVLASGVYAEKVAVISKVQGDVLIQKAEDFDYNTPVTMGMILENNDQIKVNDGFAVMLLLDDKSQVKLRENSEVAIALVEDIGGTGYHVRLEYGQALTKYEKGADFGFQLHTPTSVASIKGTAFWTITDPETGDQVIVTEGQVDVMNNLTGMISTAGPGQTVSSTTDGYIQTGETEEGSIPQDPEEETPAVEEETGDAGSDSTATETEMVEEEGDTTTDDMPPVPPSAVAETTPEAEEEEAEQDGGGGGGLAMDAGFGAVTIDGQLYNQIALRPDFSIGKFGIGLDVVIYMDQDGNIRKDEWNDAKDVIDKIMYVRWGEPGDPLYVRVGTLENVVLGYGLFMNGYSNMMEYPSVRKTGHHIGFKLGNFGIENVVANYKEFSFSGESTGLGIMGLRGTFSLGKLTFGSTVVMDNNQYLGLKDDDGDYIPNLVDDFPDDAAYSKDTDGDGRPDASDDEWDIDGDGKTDNYTPDPTRNWDDEITRKPDPFDISENPSTVGGVSVDMAYPILNMDKLKLIIFAEAGQYFGTADSMYYDDNDVIRKKEVLYGMGATAPGLRAQIFNFLTASLEFRITPTGNFIYGLFDRNYDLERVGFVNYAGMGLTPRTRYEKLYDNPSMMGVFGSLGADLFGLVTLQAGYQHMASGDDVVKGIQGSIGLAPNLIPKIQGANAYILRMNVDDPFDIVSEGTLLGYKVTVGLGGGATLTWDFRQSYIDLNGDGEIDTGSGSGEVVAQTSIETGFSF
ncbi:MAG: FecR domain-containing protein [Candidatus Marinimicrobia bacterium]|nr:FecR domain-containing protein [FCB group bacterium]MBL7025921.1 FecR domain-containing protein [Candidatus Neomarinimicrobiota bacterium]